MPLMPRCHHLLPRVAVGLHAAAAALHCQPSCNPQAGCYLASSCCACSLAHASSEVLGLELSPKPRMRHEAAKVK